MVFDANLVLIDGSVTYGTGTDAAPTSTTRSDTTGAAVIDIKGTGAKGLVACLVCPELLVAADAYYITCVLEVSDEEAFGDSTLYLHELGKFQILGGTSGRILGSETPCVAMLRFATDKRYVRINGTASADFGAVSAHLSPYPFLHL